MLVLSLFGLPKYMQAGCNGIWRILSVLRLDQMPLHLRVNLVFLIFWCCCLVSCYDCGGYELQGVAVLLVMVG